MSTPRLVLALVVGLVIAGGPGMAAAAPTAAAPPAEDDHVTQLETGGDPLPAVATPATLTSGETYWQGQSVTVTADLESPLELWLVAESGQLSHRVRTLDTDENGSATVPTDSLAGRYVLMADGAPVYVHDGAAYQQNPPNGGAVTVAQSAFQVEPQGLSADWADQTVYPGQAATLSITSNRSGSVAALSADGLSFQNLTTLVPETAYADDYDARANESELLVALEADTTLQLNTAPFDPGIREVHLDVVDATATTTPVLTVKQPGEATITSITRHEQVGDVVELNVSCGHCFLAVGRPGQGMLDLLELSDGNGDGTVALRVNTRYAGIGRGQADFPNDVRAYPSATDEVTRYSSSAELEATNDALKTSTITLSDLRTELEIPPNGRSKPLPPQSLRLTVATSDYLLSRADYGDRPPTGGPLVVKDETDVETVWLEPATLSSLTSMGAPPGSGATAEELAAMVGPRGRVALGDRLVYRVNLSGVFGYLAAQGTSRETLERNHDEGLSFELRRVTDTGPEVVPLKQTTARLVADPDEDRLYLVLRTGGTGRTRLTAGEYQARFSLTGVAQGADGYHANTDADGYPYLAPGETRTVTAATTLAGPTATIRTPVEGSGPNVTDAKQLPVAGSSSVAPGAALTVVAGAADYAWEERATARVDQDGNFSARLDFSDAPGRTFDLAVIRDGAALANGTYAVYPPATGESADQQGNSSSDDSSGGSQQAANATATPAPRPLFAVDLPVIGTIAIPSVSLAMLTGLAVPAGAGLGGLVALWGVWRFVIKRVLL